MDIQSILVFLLFGAALFYVGRLVYKSIQSKKNGCSSGCGKCSVDFSDVKTPKK